MVPRIFISWSHDSSRDLKFAHELARRLDFRGHRFVWFNPSIPYVLSPAEWARVAEDLRDWADFVLVLCSKSYYDFFHGKPPICLEEGARWEKHLFEFDLYPHWNPNTTIVPVLFNSGDKKYIPEPLQGYAYYMLDPKDPRSEENYERLYALIDRPKGNLCTLFGGYFESIPKELFAGELLLTELREFEELETEEHKLQINRGRLRGESRRPIAPTTPIADPSGVSITCHFSAAIDEAVVVHHATTVEVVLSRETLKEEVSRTTAVSSGPVDTSQKIIVQTIPRKNFETIGEDRAECDPPKVDDPIRLYFDVRPTQLGEAELWVVIRQGQVPISTLVLKPVVVERRPRSVKRSPAEARAVMPKPYSEPIQSLRITEIFNGSECRYLYDLESQELRLLRRFESAPLRGNRETYVKGIYSEIERRWVSNAGDVEAFNQDLRAYGAALFEELFPEQLQRILWENRLKLNSVMIISTEPFIPWEIVHLKEPGQPLADEIRFFAQLGLVRWLHGTWPPEDLNIGEGMAFYVIPDYPDRRWKLPEAQKEKDFLVLHFHAKQIRPTPREVRRCLAEGKLELLHFAGHGQAESNDISRAKIMLEGRIEGGKYVPAYLESVTVQQFAKLGQLHPIVMLNACQAGRLGNHLTSIGGFAKAFLEAGAGVFVGCLWSVGDDVARVFVECLYKRLLEGIRLSDATFAARDTAHQGSDGAWLAYTVYGHPHAKLSCNLSDKPGSTVEAGSRS